MRSFIRASSLAIVVSVASAGLAVAQGAPSKLAYINSQQIIAQAPGFSEAQGQFEKERQAYQRTVQTFGDSLNQLIAAYQKAEATLSPAAKEARQKQIRDREAGYTQRAQQLEEQLQQKQQALVQPLMDRITQIIDAIRMEEGYAMIFDVASGSGVLVSADRNLDITERVLARLRSTASAPAGGAKPASGTKPAGAPMPAPAGVSRPKSPNR